MSKEMGRYNIWILFALQLRRSRRYIPIWMEHRLCQFSYTNFRKVLNVLSTKLKYKAYRDLLCFLITSDAQTLNNYFSFVNEADKC
jgi:hypothetical protein